MPGVDDALVAKLCSRRVFSTASPVKNITKEKQMHMETMFLCQICSKGQVCVFCVCGIKDPLFII